MPLSSREKEVQNIIAAPVKDRLTMIKSIYETNVLKDPIFLSNKNKLSQLRYLKDHGHSSVSPLRLDVAKEEDFKKERSNSR
jgi:hypothetical protein